MVNKPKSKSDKELADVFFQEVMKYGACQQDEMIKSRINDLGENPSKSDYQESIESVLIIMSTNYRDKLDEVVIDVEAQAVAIEELRNEDEGVLDKDSLHVWLLEYLDSVRQVSSTCSNCNIEQPVINRLIQAGVLCDTNTDCFYRDGGKISNGDKATSVKTASLEDMSKAVGKFQAQKVYNLYHD